MKLKTKLNILTWIVFPIAFGLMFSVNWKVAIGVMLFGWGMNLENKMKELS